MPAIRGHDAVAQGVVWRVQAYRKLCRDAALAELDNPRDCERVDTFRATPGIMKFNNNIDLANEVPTLAPDPRRPWKSR